MSVLIPFVYKFMIGSSKNNRENYPRKCFWTQEKETRVKFNPGLSANRPLNNWALDLKPGLPRLLTGREVVTCMPTRHRGRKSVRRARSARHARVSCSSPEKREKVALFCRLIIRKQEEVLKFQKRKGTWRFLNNGLVFVAPLHNLWILTTKIIDSKR